MERAVFCCSVVGARCNLCSLPRKASFAWSLERALPARVPQSFTCKSTSELYLQEYLRALPVQWWTTELYSSAVDPRALPVKCTSDSIQVRKGFTCAMYLKSFYRVGNLGSKWYVITFNLFPLFINHAIS